MRKRILRATWPCDRQEFAAIRNIIHGEESPDEGLPSQLAPNPTLKKSADAPASVYSARNSDDLERDQDRSVETNPQDRPQVMETLLWPDFEHTSTDAESTSSQLPPPEVIARYEQLYPGAAELIFATFSQQQAMAVTALRHRQQLESATLRAEIERAERKQALIAALAGLILLGSLAILVMVSQSWAAVVGAVAILAEVGILTFLYVREVASRSPGLVRFHGNHPPTSPGPRNPQAPMADGKSI